MLNFKWLIKKFPLLWPTYWNNKWGKKDIYYKTKSGENPVLVRSVLDSSCPEIEKVGFKLATNAGWDNDLTAKEALRWVMRNVRYVSDKKVWSKAEYWQEAPVTYAKRTGDCEDGAILMMKLMEAGGIPSWRRKLCAGLVNTGTRRVGHAYIIYLADDFEWYVLDWCYFGLDSIRYFKKKPHRKQSVYVDIWFTFNEDYSWSEHNFKNLEV